MEQAAVSLTLVESVEPAEARVVVSKALISRSWDFWLLGGFSVALWAIMMVADRFREYQSVGHHFTDIPVIFATLSLICNYPHFMFSYKFAYGRGAGFVKRHWISLLAVPLLLAGLFYLSFINLTTDPSDLLWLPTVNSFFEKFNIDFRVGTLSNWGTELFSYSFWIMNLTVGWHYSKQVYGCLVAYSKFDKYPMTRNQKMILRLNLLSVGWLNFFYMSHLSVSQNYTVTSQMIALDLPESWTLITQVVTATLAVCALVFVFGQNYLISRRLPSWNLIMPWIAFHLWWIPLFRQSEYYLFAVPFFHCLQYLPFAYKLDTKEIKGESKKIGTAVYVNAVLILIMGFLTFEFLPNLLDNKFETGSNFHFWFFTGAAAVFINIHHFFMDSVTWRSNHPHFKGRVINI